MAVRFEWDKTKNQKNISKHDSISFDSVRAVFTDPLSLTLPDRVEDGEQRFKTIGTALNGVVVVVHTIREILEGEDIIRIISARYATSPERKAYEEGDF
jgi:uncharacterized protein